jgi:hypothetical protein
MPPPDLLKSSPKWVLRAEIWRPSLFYLRPVVCCVLAVGLPGPIYFGIPFCASSITLLNHGIDVVSKEVEIVVHHVLLHVAIMSSAALFDICRIHPRYQKPVNCVSHMNFQTKERTDICILTIFGVQLSQVYCENEKILPL